MISNLAVHARNLAADPHASLLIAEEPEEDDPLAAGRVHLMGFIHPIPDEECAAARQRRLEWRPEDFAAFRFFRLEITDLYYHGGFGDLGWVSAAAYQHASDEA